ncbi:MAG: sec-independent protein translocase protein TatC [Microbacteriaceae bacterium]|jgi:sec-independent protein translocase protein TatC|nr:sec-independent protein translocase protein TatC [Microbacteriaceae bacterium]
MSSEAPAGRATPGRKRRKPPADERRMSLGAHLIELRKRLIISGLAIFLGAIGGFLVAPLVWELLSTPIMKIGESQNASINYTGITEAFDTNIQIAFLVGIVGTSPIWLYQIWAFIVPALLRKERRVALAFVGSTIPLFLAGATLGAFIFPRTVTLLLSFAPDDFSTLLTARYFLDFFIKLVLAMGIAFVLPVFLVLLNFVGILSAKGILNGWRVAILCIVIFTALATPAADILAMFMLAVPMVALYFAAAGVAWLHDRRVAQRIASYETEIGGLAV